MAHIHAAIIEELGFTAQIAFLLVFALQYICGFHLFAMEGRHGYWLVFSRLIRTSRQANFVSLFLKLS